MVSHPRSRLPGLLGAILCAAAASCIPATIGVVAGSGGGGGADAPPEPPVLTGLELSLGTLSPAFDPRVTSYTAAVGFLTSQVRVTARADAGATIAVQGAAVPSGTPSPPLDLAEAANAIAVTVTDAGGGSQRTYEIVVTRAALATLQQDGARLKAPFPGALDIFGVSVAIDGDTLAVGVPGEDGASSGTAGDPTVLSAATADSGAVFVFRRTGVGSPWLLEAYLKAHNNTPDPPGAGDGFGWRVALRGDTLAVGAPNEDSAGTGVGGSGLDDDAVDSGAAYVFVRTGTTWTQQAYLKASNTDPGDLFGYSVALDGDTLAIGAPAEDNLDGSQDNGPSGLATNAGAVYVFVRTGTTWTQQAFLKGGGALATSPDDAFGDNVALSGNTLAVSAPTQDGGTTDSGAVYVFARTGSVWQQQAALKAAHPGVSDLFGIGLALEGDVLVVGAPTEDSSATGVGGDADDEGATDAGAAYVFVRSGSTWNPQAYLKATNTRANAQFGFSLALRGQLLAIGAPEEDGGFAGIAAAADLVAQAPGSPANLGAAYLFTRSGGTWTPLAYVKGSPAADGQFARSLALDATGLLAGAPFEGSVAGLSGAAYVFR
ncbi:MAG: cadherin-like beta sandwich domain-containing protein [Planctomycetes bacterium]|nr:cadherin-like beta sandwich domain-containing protein [Planctomycetota bacterium]